MKLCRPGTGLLDIFLYSLKCSLAAFFPLQGWGPRRGPLCLHGLGLLFLTLSGCCHPQPGPNLGSTWCGQGAPPGLLS